MRSLSFIALALATFTLGGCTSSTFKLGTPNTCTARPQLTAADDAAALDGLDTFIERRAERSRDARHRTF